MRSKALQFLVMLLVAFLLATPFFYWSLQSHPRAGFLELWKLNHGLLLEILLFMLLALVLDGLGRVGRWMARILGFLVPMVLTAQFMHLYFAGSTFGEVTLDHADQVSLVVSPKSLELSLLYPVGVGLFFLWLRVSRRGSGRGLPAALLVLLAALIALPPHLASGLFPAGREERDYHWPMSELAQVLYRYRFGAHVREKSEPLDLALAREFGFGFLTPVGARPREVIYRTPFPYEATGAAHRPPNVIVLFIESLSARMVGAYGKRERSVTPNLDDFARQALRVDGYVNHTTPTVPGLFGQLCSVYPPYKAEMKGVREDAPMECLPHLLARELGYRTIYFTHSSPRYAGIGKLLVKWGFQETHLWKGFLRDYLDGEPPYLGSGGLSDHQMMRGLVNYLERNRETLSSRPFFIGLSTVETHTGRTPNEHDGVRPNPSVSDVDDAFYNMDDAFGHFWRYFLDSPYADNTIVIVTADHARFPSLDYKDVAGRDYRPSVYDEVALLIHDPFHRLPTSLDLRASTLDFAPSLYHLIGGPPERSNRLMGLSIFGDRQQTAGTVALSAYRQFGYMVVDQDGMRRRKSFDCDAETDPYCDHDRRLLDIVRRLQQLVRENRYW